MSLIEPISGLDCGVMIEEMLRELTELDGIDEATSDLGINMDPKGGGLESTKIGTGQYKRGQGILFSGTRSMKMGQC